MRTYFAILLFVLALNRAYCLPSADTSTTEVPGTQRTKQPCATESENTQGTTLESCLDKSFVSTSKSSFTSSKVSSPPSTSEVSSPSTSGVSSPSASEVSSPSTSGVSSPPSTSEVPSPSTSGVSSPSTSEVSSPSTSANKQSRTMPVSEQEQSSPYTSGQSQTAELFHQTKEITTSNLLQKTDNTKSSTEASNKKESGPAISAPNNVSSGDYTVSADNIKQSTTTPTAGIKTDTKVTSPSHKSFMKTSPTVPTPILPPGEESMEKAVPKSESISFLFNVTAPYCQKSICDEFADSLMNCFCDDLCYFYNDCCYSMIEKLVQTTDAGTPQLAYSLHEKVREIENKTIMLRKDLTACVGDVNNKSAFIMVNGCDEIIKTSEDIDEKCELSAEWYSFQNIPVDHVINGKVLATFKNIYCALCNAVPQNETLFWNIDILCQVGNVERIAQMELDEIALMEECTLRPYSMFTNSLRKCLKGDTSPEMCGKTVNAEMADLCNVYIYPLSEVLDTGHSRNPSFVEFRNSQPSQIYKNPHCAACKNDTLNISDFRCHQLYALYKPSKPENIVGPVNLQVIFDFTLDKGIMSKVYCVPQEVCKTYEIYDCASKRCRQLYCQKGETPFEGKCTEISEVTRGYVTMDTVRPVDKFDNLTNRGETLILELLSNDDANLVFYALHTTPETILKHIYDELERFLKIKKIDKMIECFCLKIRISAGEVDIFNELFQILVILFDKLEETEKRGYSLIPVFIKIRNFHRLNSLECSLGKLIVEKNPSIIKANSSVISAANSSIAFALPSSAMTVYEQNCNWKIGYDKKTGVLASLVATCFICDDRPNLNCSMIAYGFNEVTISETSMTIINTSLTFDEGDFIIFQDQVFICADKITRVESFVNVFSFSAHHRVLSLVTSLVSAVSAAVVVVAHGCLKRLKNIHGLNLSALSLLTMLMHLLLIVQSSITGKISCLIYSILLHFVLLNIFSWMSIIGYDMTRIFIGDMIVSQSSPFKRFLGYCFLSLVFPVLIVSVAASLDFTDSTFKPNYGDNDVCWLSNGKSIILFVIGPVVISLLLNFSFFTFTVKAIYSKANQTKFARNRSYFVVYLKLTLVLGLTWIVGLIGAFVKQEWLWILHLVLNGLQGLSLLICSVVNVRNIRYLRKSLKSVTASGNSKLSKSAVTENSSL